MQRTAVHTSTQDAEAIEAQRRELMNAERGADRAHSRAKQATRQAQTALDNSREALVQTRRADEDLQQQQMMATQVPSSLPPVS
jgi:hypothetical protein